MEKINGIIDKPIRIAVTGPESSGKSTLARGLAEHYEASLVPEFSREYLEKTKGKYEEKDLLTIAKGQYQKIQEAISGTHPIIISDTDLLVIKIWSAYKYDRVDPWIEQHLFQFDLYLLCKPDIPWAFDPLRENPDNRDELFKIYYRELEQSGVQFRVVEGKERQKNAIQEIDSLFF